MNARHLVSLLGLILAATASRGQEPPPPDYTSKTLKQWIEILKDRNEYKVHEHAREALGPNGPYAKEAISFLIDAFAIVKPLVDYEILASFTGTLADYGPSVVPHLVQALKRPEAPVRAAVAHTLGNVNPRPVDAVPALVDAMKDSSPDVRAAAAGSLGNIRRPIDQILPALVAALTDEHDTVRSATAHALSEIGRNSKPALPALIVSLKDKNVSVRDRSARAIMKIGPDARAAVPILIEGLRNTKHSSIRWTFANAIGGIGPDAKEAVPALIEALEEKDFMLQRCAATALQAIGPAAKSAVPALIAIAKDKNKPERDSAISALGAIGPEAKAAVPTLLELLANEGPYRNFRCYVARALGGIGPAAKEAVPMLANIARNQLDGDRVAYEPLRQAAAEAVMKIDPEYGSKHGIELSYLNIRLGKVPNVQLAPRPALTEEKKKRIKQLIADLAGLADPDYGLSPSLSGHAFSPIPGREHVGTLLLTDHRLKTSDTFRRLVEFGPDALPFLLDSLGDETPTKLKVGPGAMNFFGTEFEYNPLHSLERRTMSEIATQRDDEDDESDGMAASYTIRIGDVCFVAIGQIVGRRYLAVRYQPSMMVIINSPVESKQLRDYLRAVWSSPDPARKLLDSLLLDYATEGFFNGKSLAGWSEGSEWQTEAALRLLYHFPKESAPLIAERLKRTNVSQPNADDNDGEMKRDVANGVETTAFLKALTWCMEPAIRKAMLDIFERTDDEQVTMAVLSAVKEARSELVVPRLRSMIAKLPESEHSARRDGYDLLLALGQHAGKDARRDYESYVRNGSLQRRWTMCIVLQEVHSEWALEFLTPMLTDKRTGYANETGRLCDTAASTLSEIHTDLTFDLSDSLEERDRQIEQMRKQIAQMGKE